VTIRDLGYRAYEGRRMPPSHNMKVLLRHSLGRAWASWLVKITVFVCWIPLLIGAFRFWIDKQERAFLAQPGVAARFSGELPPLELGSFVHWVVIGQVWFFVSMITLGAGSGAISRDLANKGFQFYFSKPVTAPQYLIGRVSAVAIWVFFVVFLPAMLMALFVAGMAPEDMRLEAVGLLLPALIDSLLIALVVACCSVGISASSKSTALTMSAWMLVFVVPHVLASIVHGIGDAEWLYLLSIPGLLEIVGNSLFKETSELDLTWWHALPPLAIYSVGSVLIAMRRVRSAEVIT